MGAQIATASMAGSSMRRSVSNEGTPSSRPTSSAKGIIASETAARATPATREAKRSACIRPIRPVPITPMRSGPSSRVLGDEHEAGIHDSPS